jgi:hypothetical protein
LVGADGNGIDFPFKKTQHNSAGTDGGATRPGNKKAACPDAPERRLG